MFSVAVLQAQIRGIVVDKKTKLPIPFASVFLVDEHQKSAASSDMQGYFQLPNRTAKKLTVSCLGYRPQEISVGDSLLSPSSLLTVELEEYIYPIDEVMVIPQNNPALRIMRRVLQNKHRNNFERYEDYSYRCYYKAQVAIQIPSNLSTADSIRLDSLMNGAGFISEAVSLCRKSGDKTEDKIIATRASGFKTPLTGQIFYSFFPKAISFYNHSIPIFGEPTAGGENKMTMEYLTPLSSGALNAYNFQLEREYAVGSDTIFEISYFPKKHANFNSLIGTMLISSKGYALASMVAHPYEKGLIDFKFKQDYEYVDGRWFPSSMEEEISFVKLHVNDNTNTITNMYLAYLITSSIDSVSFDGQKGRLRGQDRIYLDERSVAQSAAIIERLRPVALLPKEQKVYSTMDSLLEKHPFVNSLFDAIPKLADGKLPVGMFDVDLLRLVSSNECEGTRWGFGLYTNERLMKYLSVGGYAGYGVKDKKVKYGGEVEVVLNRSRSAKLTGSLQNSMREVGGDMSIRQDIRMNYFKSMVASRFEYCAEAKVEGSYHILPSLKASASLSARDVTLAYDYAYRDLPMQAYTDDAVQLTLRYSAGEQYSLFGVTRLLLSTGNPTFTAQYTRGVDFLRKSGFAYNKLQASVDITGHNGRIGQSKLRLEGGYVDRSLPYGLLFTGEGSKGKSLLSFVIPNTFQSMRPDEFLSDRYAHLFYLHNFGELLLKTRWVHPNISVAYNAAWGALSDAAAHRIDFRTQSRVYQEAGLILDNLLRLNYLNVMYIQLGFGGFVRFGSYEYSKFEDNLALKASITMSFKK
jgi:hypothetical protein